MKKTLIAVAAAAALTATSAFAEITFGAWLRSITGVASNGEDILTGTSNSWGGMRPSRLNVAGTSEDGNVGFKLDVYFNATKAQTVNADGTFSGSTQVLEVGDNAYLWVKPASSVQIALGKFDGGETGLRGDFCYGSWNWLRPSNWIADDEGFTFNGSHTDGFMAKITPVDGLVAVVQLPVYNSDWGGYNNAYQKETVIEGVKIDAKYTIEDTFKNGMYAAAYSIEGLGTLKAGYFGSYAEKNKKSTKKVYTTNTSNLKNSDGDPSTNGLISVEEELDPAAKDSKQIGTVNVAFDFNAVENLFVTVGARFGIADKEFKADNEKMKITAGASYQVSDAMKFSVSGGYVQYQDKCTGKDGKDDSAFGIGAGVDYAIMDGLNAAADLRYKSNAGADSDGAISFLVGVTKNVSSNGYIGVGFQGATNGNGLTGIKANADDFVWAIPVALQIGF
ncbi:porin [uncultured Treponema sp.]|uniref:porin n=1 Tax=uncultured Treponema sp. TaxID=162155 RepID=UPI0025FB3A1F|nr:porin [uncultured Treponema sp.]